MCKGTQTLILSLSLLHTRTHREWGCGHRACCSLEFPEHKTKREGKWKPFAGELRLLFLSDVRKASAELVALGRWWINFVLNYVGWKQESINDLLLVKPSLFWVSVLPTCSLLKAVVETHFLSLLWWHCTCDTPHLLICSFQGVLSLVFPAVWPWRPCLQPCFKAYKTPLNPCLLSSLVSLPSC